MLQDIEENRKNRKLHAVCTRKFSEAFFRSANVLKNEFSWSERHIHTYTVSKWIDWTFSFTRGNFEGNYIILYLHYTYIDRMKRLESHLSKNICASIRMRTPHYGYFNSGSSSSKMKTLWQREKTRSEQKVKSEMNERKRPDASMCVSSSQHLTSILDELISRCKWVGISLETELKLVQKLCWRLNSWGKWIHTHTHRE